jgi:benzodiazapine receptor
MSTPVGTELAWLGALFWVAANYVQFDNGASMRTSQSKWYKRRVADIALQPPAWLFGPAWAAFYLLDGLAHWYFWKDNGDEGIYHITLALIVAYLLFNKLWSVLFFGARQITWALIVLVIMVLLRVILLVLTGDMGDKLVFWMLIPQTMWIMFAGYLNYSFKDADEKICDDDMDCGRGAKGCRSMSLRADNGCGDGGDVCRVSTPSVITQHVRDTKQKFNIV